MIPEEILDISYCRSSGPGGQHVNKTSSKAVIRIKIDKIPNLNAQTKENIVKNNPSRINNL